MWCLSHPYSKKSRNNPSTHLESSIALLRTIRSVVSIAVSLTAAVIVSIAISMAALARLREGIRHLCWCASRRGNLRSSSGGDFPGGLAGADLYEVVLARSEALRSDDCSMQISRFFRL